MSEIEEGPESQGSLLPRWANPSRWSKRAQRIGWILLCVLFLALSPNPWVTGVNIVIVYVGYRIVRWCWRVWERIQVKDAVPDDDQYGLLTVEQRAWDDLVRRLKADEG